MADKAAEYLTTRELAALLRIKERKVYDLAAAGEVPCSRATGKLLFPRGDVEAWIASKSSGRGPTAAGPRPRVVLGSHDPLLEWALRESGSGLATYLDGSRDGLSRFAAREGVAAAVHLFDAEQEAWNVPEVARRFARQPVVLVGFAERERGLVVAPDNPLGIRDVADFAGHRVVPRQAGAGSQDLLLQRLARAGVDSGGITFTDPARTETDAAVEVLEDRADIAFGLAGVARSYRLDFVPVVRERFDLLVDRRDWFEPELQALARFCREPRFAERARELGGYDVTGCAEVRFNGDG